MKSTENVQRERPKKCSRRTIEKEINESGTHEGDSRVPTYVYLAPCVPQNRKGRKISPLSLKFLNVDAHFKVF